MHPSVTGELDRFVEAFEAAQRAGAPPTDLGPFLPPPADSYYLLVLRELVCVDLDYGWGRGNPTSLDEYRRRFPRLFDDPTAVKAIVWEDYRQRRQAGQEPDPEDYHRRYGVNPVEVPARPEPIGNGDVPPTEVMHVRPVAADDLAARLEALGAEAPAGAADLYRAARRSDPAAADRYARAMAAMPKVGEAVAGFRLMGELGRGAFGRVFLARDIHLDRAVALKISAELFGEDKALARLHHTNIVEIYSQHRVGTLHAVCMSYDGSTTLADVFRALGKTLPKSGRQFVSTVHGRKPSTVRDKGSNDITPPGDPAALGTPLPEAGRGAKEVDDSPPSLLGKGAGGLGQSLAALEHLSYPEAVLWLGAKLASGLAHAHDRGVIHRDLKPANILITDDGEPMLIDFNLADGKGLRGSEVGARVGGTLPYMSPEQLRAFHRLGERITIDGRSDIYSLGLMLFELLTGSPAYPTPSDRGSAAIAKLIVDREGLPPRLRTANPVVSPAVEAIIRKCLEPDPARRYQTARDLKEDIERQLDHRPLKHVKEPSRRERLKKWAVRHPRLTSGTSVGLLAAVLLVAVGTVAFALHHNVRRRVAAESLTDFNAKLNAVSPQLIRSLDTGRRANAIDDARKLVAGYGVFDRPDWQTGPLMSDLPPEKQDQLRERLGELLFQLAQSTFELNPEAGQEALRFNELAAACFGNNPPRAVLEQKARLLTIRGDTTEADKAADAGRRLSFGTPAGCYLHGLELYREGRFGDALPFFVRTTETEPEHYPAWFVRGNCHYFSGQDLDAARCYGECIRLAPNAAPPYYNRARAMDRLKNLVQAVKDADRAVELAPDWVEARIDAALTRFRVAIALSRPDATRTTRDELLTLAGVGLPKKQETWFREAEERFSAILAQPDAPTRCYFHRADVRRILGNKDGAAADMEQGFAREPAADDEMSWSVRGLKWHEIRKQPEKALADLRRAERINPRSSAPLQNQSHVLGDLNRHEENLAVLNRLLDMYPEMAEARAGRAVQLARLGRTKEALADTEWVLAHSSDPLLTYQIAGVYSLTGDTRQALRLIARALMHGVGYEYLSADPELNPIRKEADFRRLLDAVRTLQEFLKPTPVPAGAN
jgi:serine/threonine protein kinase/Flp pilus assembly protein TadD